ncbi:hypothetical protein SBA2_90026 [Acidobacteriia bacterium SbA2]|nr:hypothetical protein SBA2_90026 [Acidobacteriia bacterium SbA2]
MRAPHELVTDQCNVDFWHVRNSPLFTNGVRSQKSGVRIETLTLSPQPSAISKQLPPGGWLIADT